MLRKTSLTTLLLMSCSAPAWCHGFYVGISGGPDVVDFKQVSYVVSVPSLNVKNLSYLSGTGLFGSLFGGYTWNYNQLALSAEANINLSSVDARDENDEFVHSTFNHTDRKMQDSYGFSLLPGYMVTNATMFYGRVGYANSNLKISTTDVTLANINTRLNGLRLGLGINQAFNQNFSGRLEYAHTSYQSTTFTTVTEVNKKTTITPQEDQVLFAVVYNFA